VKAQQKSEAKANSTAESDVWVQPSAPKDLSKKSEGAKKEHKNLKGMVRDFSIQKQKKYQEKEEKKEAK
jgi:hypothetical protein